MTETIYALASGKGRAGVAIIRISGPETKAVTEALSGQPVPPARLAKRAWIRDPETQALLDDGLILWFAAPASYTGEDLVELHIHGGTAVRNAVFDAIRKLGKARMAEPGEFTRRAFQNGKMDLTEAEGLIDLIDAETEAQRLQALQQSRGALGTIYMGWADRLTRILAYYEAEIDFADEDLPEDLGQKTRPQLDEICVEIRSHLDDNRRGERLREGVHIAIIGPPNAGKSSLLNLLAQREAAIVSDIAGTTRDVVEVHLDLRGYPVIVSDTAGLRETDDVIEQEGVRRALARAEEADLIILVVDVSKPEEASATLDEFGKKADLVILNKADQTNKVDDGFLGDGRFAVSVKSGDGIGALLSSVGEMVESRFGLKEAPAITRQRHREALQECLGHIERSFDAYEVVLAAEDLRLAVRALGRITGRVDVEDLLDVIFKDFCIGK